MTGRAIALAFALAACLAGGWFLFARADVGPVALAARVIALPFGIAAPDLDDPARISRGARHYAQFCVACHGSPGEPRRTIARALRPPAPVLHLRLEELPDELIFATVRDGVANSGMPAWPAPVREDEVWDMVAFVRLLPALDAAAYRDLTEEDRLGDLRGAMRGCVRCHGADGEGGDGIPRLDIQSPDYLFQALRAFRDGDRASGVMQIAVQGLGDDTLARLAREFAAARPPEPRLDNGEPPALVTRGVPERKIPPCAACHGVSVPVRPEFPVLAGQDRRYLELQLHLFAAEGEVRGGGPYHHLMESASHNLEDAYIRQAVRWYGAGE